MASDRSRKTRSLRRRGAIRQPFKRVLIVCEGEKTEPNYFEEIRKLARVSPVHIRVIKSELGTQPLRVVESAINEFKKAKAYDHVYAVFDRDDHENYANAIAKADTQNVKLKNDERKAITFRAIVSVPCFEFWLLLHFEDVHQWLHRDVVYNRLRAHMPEYQKNAKDTYSTTKHLLDIATARASALRVHYARLPGNEAYTDVDELVAFLKSLKK